MTNHSQLGASHRVFGTDSVEFHWPSSQAGWPQRSSRTYSELKSPTQDAPGRPPNAAAAVTAHSQGRLIGPSKQVPWKGPSRWAAWMALAFRTTQRPALVPGTSPLARPGWPPRCTHSTDSPQSDWPSERGSVEDAPPLGWMGPHRTTTSPPWVAHSQGRMKPALALAHDTTANSNKQQAPRFPRHGAVFRKHCHTMYRLHVPPTIPIPAPAKGPLTQQPGLSVSSL